MKQPRAITIHPAIFLLLALPVCRLPAVPPVFPESGTTRSLSGQFIIHDQRRGGSSEMAGLLTTNAEFTAFDPTVLAVSCERLKQDVWRLLGISSGAGNKVHIVLLPATSPNDNIGIVRTHYRNGWQYHVDLPDTTERVRYVRAMAQVVLLDFANQNSATRSAEIPSWLLEGVTQQLMSSDAIEIILPPPRHDLNGHILSVANVNARREDPLNNARAQLRAHPVLTFADLSWPEERAWNDESAELYRLSAQLFLHELLTIEGGQSRLREMLSLLPERYNWQVAFIEAFREDFPRLLEVEKWWALRTLRFTSPNLIQILPMDESWRRLEVALRQAADLRTSTNELPARTETNLQAVVSGWDRKSQIEAVQSRLRDLELLRPRLAPALVPVADGYRQALGSYLEQIGEKSQRLTIRKQAAYKRAQTAVLDRLNQLDSRLDALKPRDEPVADTRKVPIDPVP